MRDSEGRTIDPRGWYRLTVGTHRYATLTGYALLRRGPGSDDINGIRWERA